MGQFSDLRFPNLKIGQSVLILFSHILTIIPIGHHRSSTFLNLNMAKRLDSVRFNNLCHHVQMLVKRDSLFPIVIIQFHP